MLNNIVAVINRYWHLHQHSPLCKWSWSSTACTCILNLCIMLVNVYFLHNETFVCMQVPESPTCMTNIQYTILNKLCIVCNCMDRLDTSKYYVLISKTLLFWPFNMRTLAIYIIHICVRVHFSYIPIVLFFPITQNDIFICPLCIQGLITL